MATINKAGTIKRILDDAKIQTSIDDVPTQLAKSVVPVLISNPQKVCNVVANNAKTTTGGQTLYTVPDTGDFYLNSLQVSIDCDVVCDSVLYYVGATMDGKTVRLFDFRKTTAVVTNETAIITFPMPIRLDNGSTISIVQTFTAGASTMSGCITGFYLE